MLSFFIEENLIPSGEDLDRLKVENELGCQFCRYLLFGCSI